MINSFTSQLSFTSMNGSESNNQIHQSDNPYSKYTVSNESCDTKLEKKQIGDREVKNLGIMGESSKPSTSITVGCKSQEKDIQDINVTYETFATALYTAAHDKNFEPVKRLISDGADVNAKDENGVTPLHLAAEWGEDEAADLLISYGADVNTKDKNGVTPLHLVAKWGKDEAANLIISYGADVNAKDKNGVTPLHLAAKWENIKLINLLIDHGADIHATMY